MAEWLRRGLQILARRFDSGSGLHLRDFDGLRPLLRFAQGRLERLLQLAAHDPPVLLAERPHLHDGTQDRGRSEEHTSELQSLMRISYAVLCLTKKTNTQHSNVNPTYQI